MIYIDIFKYTTQEKFFNQKILKKFNNKQKYLSYPDTFISEFQFLNLSNKNNPFNKSNIILSDIINNNYDNIYDYCYNELIKLDLLPEAILSFLSRKNQKQIEYELKTDILKYFKTIYDNLYIKLKIQLTINFKLIILAQYFSSVYYQHQQHFNVISAYIKKQ